MSEETGIIAEQVNAVVKSLLDSAKTRPLTEADAKSYGARETFSDEKQTLMNMLTQVVGSLRANLDQQLIKDSIAAYDNTQKRFRTALNDLFQSYQNSEITAADFEKAFRNEIKSAWADAYEAGVGAAGSPFGVYDEDLAWLKGDQAEEFKYLKGFVADMEAGEGTMDYEDRLGLYVNTLDSIFSHAQVESSPDNVEIWWELDPDTSRSCATCLERGDPDNNPWTKDTLPGVPGDGCECLGNCRCHLRIVQKTEAPEPSDQTVWAVAPQVPEIPSGKRLPTFVEYEFMSRLSIQIDHLRGLISTTTGDVQADFIKQRKDINKALIDFMDANGLYYVPRSNYYQGAANPFLGESLEDRFKQIPGHRLLTEEKTIKACRILHRMHEKLLSLSKG